MKLATLCLAVALASGTAGASLAQSHGKDVVLRPQDLKWGPAPPSLPPGAEAAVLYGDPSKAGPFVIRLKLPKGYHIPAHSHPSMEAITVLSGQFHLGMGAKADRAQAQALPPGSFFTLQAGMHHYAWADEESVVQINSTGPFDITYVNPADDPRKKK
ncbi:cupin domain-containing protein [Caulobacter sp. 17J65-9]|uniref:cupin domain-containing protein n=1 Tax=Caulobacter sp. 17J65-9 TaxID=2709382 RepID=UPI0013C910AD|nr:cupin domain-containing protein [Caulobacter sp. 17J65-9]NEX91846.1 DUF4437 domain-containing protein [Caulobacter sp. 17J65-9]